MTKVAHPGYKRQKTEQPLSHPGELIYTTVRPMTNMRHSDH